MFSSTPFYWETLSNTTKAFGSLFSDIKIQRKEKSGSKSVIQTIKVPVAQAAKDKWVTRTEQDGSLENQVYLTMPRIAYEMTGMSYDPSRKIGKLNKITCRDEDGGTSIYAPVPYNLEFSVYLVGKTQEDVMQMAEQILPYFSPEYTMSVMTIPNQNIVTDIPIILNSVTISDDYEGDYTIRRSVTYTLNFQLKINLFGPASESGLIKKSIINMTEQNMTYSAEQETPTSDIIETVVIND